MYTLVTLYWRQLCYFLDEALLQYVVSKYFWAFSRKVD